ncbi:hypothetical protein [Blastococcus sp. SYSU D00813]
MHSRPSRGTLVATALAVCALLSACADQGDAAPSGSAQAGTPKTAERTGAAAVVEPETAAPAFPADADWKLLSYPAAGCMTREEYTEGGYVGPEGWDAATVRTSSGDVTGDGVDEVLVLVNCPVPTSSMADVLVVLQATAGPPEVIGVLPDDVSFLGATVTTGDRALTLEGPSRTDADPMCCPGSWARATYSWTGSGFVLAERLEAATTQPFGREPLADGEYVAELADLGEDEVLVDVVQWFDGPAAEAACREDGNWSPDVSVAACSTYYWRNDNDLVRVLPVAAGASLRAFDPYAWTTVPVPDLAALGAWSEQNNGSGFYRFTVERGEVTVMEEFFVS